MEGLHAIPLRHAPETVPHAKFWKPRWARTALVVGSGLVVAVSYLLLRPSPELLQVGAGSAGKGDRAFSYADYATVLGTYVDARGMVDYRGLKAHREGLDSFAAAVGALDPKAYDAWTEKEKLVFLINAYNALTLKLIIDHYPIKSSFTTSLIYPKNSIRQISGAWDEVQFPVMGRRMTLDGIEHGIIREEFDEPRIHIVLVCAAMGCPPLLNEPFSDDRLEAQLGGRTRRLLENPEKFRIARDEGRVYLSAIFKWYGDDFIRTYGTDEQFAGYSQVERAVLNFISSYLDENDREYLATGRYAIKYLDYDWSLNEQGKR